MTAIPICKYFCNIIYSILQIYSLRQTIYIANILDNIFVIYIANILYNIFAIYCLFQIKMIYDKPIRQYVWYIYFANILYNIFAIPICKCNSNMFSVWTILYCKYIEQYICDILSVSIKMINDNPIRQYICNTYANVLDNIFTPNILCSI